MQFPAMVRDSLHIQKVQIGSLDHPPSYQQEPEHLPQGQVVGNEADHSPSSSAKVKSDWNCIFNSHMPSWYA